MQHMNNIKMYHLNGTLQGETYSSLHISQLTCVIITMAVWNNPAMNSQAKPNCTMKIVLLHALLKSSVELK
jgi:hypothetical protein